jgi:hypothetical protein
MKNFVFWAIMVSFRKNYIWSLFLNSISTIFKRKKEDVNQVAYYNNVTIRIDFFNSILPLLAI